MWTYYFNNLIHGLPFFLKGLWVTVQVSFLSLMTGTLIGAVLGVLKTLKIRPLRWLLTLYADVVRGTPYLVQIFIFFFILPEWGLQMSAFHAAVISLSLYAGAYICEIVASGIDAIPKGQWEAAMSCGLTWSQQLRLVILPQALRGILPPLVGQYVLLIKDSSIVSVIGLTDVTRVGWLTVQRIPEGMMVFGLVGVLYFSVCYPLIHLANWFEKRLAVQVIRL